MLGRVSDGLLTPVPLAINRSPSPHTKQELVDHLIDEHGIAPPEGTRATGCDYYMERPTRNSWGTRGEHLHQGDIAVVSVDNQGNLRAVRADLLRPQVIHCCSTWWALASECLMTVPTHQQRELPTQGRQSPLIRPSSAPLSGVPVVRDKPTPVVAFLHCPTPRRYNEPRARRPCPESSAPGSLLGLFEHTAENGQQEPSLMIVSRSSPTVSTATITSDNWPLSALHLPPPQLQHHRHS